MSYTDRLLYDLKCNYLDLSKTNASHIIFECINEKIKPKIKTQNIEGFAADYSSGVRYIPNNMCPNGYTKIDNQCHQVCRGCNYTDRIEKSLYQENSKELLNSDLFDYALTDTDWEINQDI